MNLKNCETIHQTLTTAAGNLNSIQIPSPARSWFSFRSNFATRFPRLLGLALITLALLSAASITRACGPFFPNNLLSGGDEVLLTAPVANFRRELERLNLAPSRFDHIAATNGYEQQTFDAELADLAAALKRTKVSGEEAAPIVAAHRKNRDKLQRYRDEHAAWESKSWMNQEEKTADKRGPEPEFPSFNEVPGLPGEFADYFAGVVALRAPEPDREAALKAWGKLLEHPANERKYKSTWAAYMLGKLWDEEDDDKAVEYFQMTRSLAKQRFADSAGLAVAALGWEARVELRRDHFKRAFELYLEQYAAGDESAVQSLRITALKAVNAGGDQLAELARAANTRAIITAYLISDRMIVDYPTGDAPAVRPVEAWLSAVEAAGIKDLESAERLALAAYQDGEFELAERWIKRARNSAVAQWLQAKLFLRAGKIPQAAALLAKVTHALPVVPQNELTNSTEFVDALRVPNDSYQLRISREQLLGELGVLSLSRGDFSQALDALLRANFWEDAAYVAERVLTVDELKAYVDREWPTRSAATNAPEAVVEADAVFYDGPTRSEVGPEKIRHLLGRRLVRELRGREALPYFPLKLQSRCGELMDALDAGWNEAAPAEQRAQSLFTAAKIARADGMELLGTELAPDWFIHGGNFEDGLTWQDRSTNATEAKINIASEAELNRATRHHADPEERFHYRYQAASLAWEAAKLMPNNSDETARVLCTAGTWLKNRDPETADLFYKALVKRCRKTAIGEQADRMRWFPVLDESGNPVPWQPRIKIESFDSLPPDTVPTPPSSEGETVTINDSPLPGDAYIIQRGDTFLSIAHAAAALGRSITVRDLAKANPGVDPSHLSVGRKILIPQSAPEAKPSEESVAR